MSNETMFGATGEFASDLRIDKSAAAWQTSMLMRRGEVHQAMRRFRRVGKKLQLILLNSIATGELPPDGEDDPSLRQLLENALHHLELIELGVQCRCAKVPERQSLDLNHEQWLPQLSRFNGRWSTAAMLLHRINGESQFELPEPDPMLFARILSVESAFHAEMTAVFLEKICKENGERDAQDILFNLQSAVVLASCLAERDSLEGDVLRACAGFFDFVDWMQQLNDLLESCPDVNVNDAIRRHFVARLPRKILFSFGMRASLALGESLRAFVRMFPGHVKNGDIEDFARRLRILVGKVMVLDAGELSDRTLELMEANKLRAARPRTA